MRAKQLTANIRVSSVMLLLNKAFPVRNSTLGALLLALCAEALSRGAEGTLPAGPPGEAAGTPQSAMGH